MRELQRVRGHRGHRLSEPLLELRDVMRRLRAECPWKAAQTHRSLARYLLEETHEVLELLDLADHPAADHPGADHPGADHPGADRAADAHLAEELGDLLLQVYFHAAIAEERGAFTVDDVARGITAKMYRRNPHVFDPDETAPPPAGAAAVDEAWQDIKAAEGPPSELPDTLPALLLAAKTLQRRARAGEVDPRAGDKDGEAGQGGEAGQRGGLGDRLLALVAEAVETDTDPEQALRDAVRRLA